MNYDSTNVGVPYVRAHQINIFYPDNNAPPMAEIFQSLAVKMADNTVRKLEDIPKFARTFDLVSFGNDPIQIVDPTSGQALPANSPTLQALAGAVLQGKVTLNLVMLALLAVVRQEQTRPVE